MRSYCFLFLALIFVTRAQNQFTLCATNNVCTNVAGSCTCVQDPSAPAGTSPCTQTICMERICTAACGQNCQCTVKADASTNTATCSSTCSCPDVGKLDVCTGAGTKPTCQTGSISCVASATGGCAWSACSGCADAGKLDVCGNAGTKPTCTTAEITCTTNPNGVCAWSTCPACRDVGKLDVCTGAGTKPTCETGSSTCTATLSGACAWSECPTCPDAGSPDRCGNAVKPTCTTGTLVCTTDVRGGCAWSSCPAAPTCTATATGMCGDESKPTTGCDGTWKCGLTPDNVCGWSCIPPTPTPATTCYDPVAVTCNGKPKPDPSNVCPSAVFECVPSGTSCGWTARCPTTDLCAAAGACSGATPATCPTGFTVVDGSSVCKQDQNTGKCALFASCTATTNTNCLSTVNGVELCGQVQKPTRCLNPNQVVPTGATYTARCSSVLSSGVLKCNWVDNCVSACQPDAKGLCNGKPMPTACDPGFYSTTATPAFECVGTGGDTCTWASRQCYAGCKFGWPISSPPTVPTCGGTSWPCTTVSAELQASLFTSDIGLAGSSVQVSNSRVASLCTQNADGKCVFPSITCPTQKCFAQLQADGAVTCGGKKFDPTAYACTGSQVLASAPVCVEAANALTGCDWKVSCTDPVNTITCLKDTARRTCGNEVVPDTCATGTVFADFDCKDDPAAPGKCFYQARCATQTQCSANYDACANLIKPTCAATETQLAAPLCCSANGKAWFDRIKCAPTDPCTTCAFDATKAVCPTGQTMVAPPSCVKSASGSECVLTPPKCTNSSSNCDCNVIRPCSFGQKQVSVKCDPTLCIGIPECVADTCTGNDPCKCDSANGCVWVTAASNTATKSFCVNKASYTVNLGTVGLASRFCQAATTGPTPVKDPVVGAVSEKTYTQTTLAQAIADFIAAIKALETKTCRDGTFCGFDFSISIFAIATPSRNSDGSLTVSVTLLFSNRDSTSTVTPSQAHYELYTNAIKKLLAQMTGFPETEFANLQLNFAVSGKRAISQGGAQSNDASLTVPANTVNKYYGASSASSSLVSGLFCIVFALVMFFY